MGKQGKEQRNKAKNLLLKRRPVNSDMHSDMTREDSEFSKHRDKKEAEHFKKHRHQDSE